MKTVSLDCIKALLPSFITEWTIAAGAPAAAAVGIASTGVAAPFVVSAICLYLACSLKGKEAANRNLDHDRKAIHILQDYARKDHKDHAALAKQLDEIGYEVEVTQAVLDQRLDALEALVQKPDADHDELIAFFEKQEGLFISLSSFLEDNFDEVRDALGRQDLKLGDLRESNAQVLIELASLREDFRLLAERITEKYERAESQMSGRIAEQSELIDLQRQKLASAEQDLSERERRITDLESALREARAAADTGDTEAQAALDAIRQTGDIRLLRDAIDRFADARHERERQRSQQEQAHFIQQCKESASLSETLGDLTKAKTRYERILALDPTEVDATNRLGNLHRTLGNLDAAVDCFRKLPELRPGEDIWAAISCGNLAVIYLTRGDMDQAEIFLHQSLVINEKLGRLHGIASQYGNLGLMYRIRGELDQAEAMHIKSLAIEEKLGSLEGMASQYGNLGLIYRIRGELDQAETMHTQSLAINLKLDRLEGLASDYNNLGGVHLTRGELDKAEVMLQKSLAINDKLGYLEGMANQYGNLGLIYRIHGELDQAESMYRQSLAINEKLGRLEGMAIQYGNLGVIYQTRGELDQAESMYRKSLTINLRLERKEGMANQYGNLGLIYLTRGNLWQAEAMLQESLAINKKLGRLEGMARDYQNLGSIAKQRGEMSEARKYWTQSIDFAMQIGMPQMVAIVQGCIDRLDSATNT